jgi:hypothetical protein
MVVVIAAALWEEISRCARRLRWRCDGGREMRRSVSEGSNEGIRWREVVNRNRRVE